MSEYFQNFNHLIKIYIQCTIQNSQTYEWFCYLLYSLSQSELKSLQEFLDEHLVMDFIHPSHLLGGDLVQFMHKKDVSLCLCLDFCSLNKITKKNCYLLDSLHKARFYLKINICHTYHLICIHKGDEWKTAFHTRYGSFEWHVMPFRLIKVPTTFLSGYTEVSLMLY